jgi:methyltransferase (TIGR00027 family)
MDSNDIKINNVSDTALWVAYYRAKETERPDALFKDPLAKVLVGERGKMIAESMKSIGRYTEWSVVSRTVMIDAFIEDLIKDGIDAVINLGAGLDTRPYRMNLPGQLKWIEVDYPHMIELKNDLLKSEQPTCQLTRVAVDLADDEKRKTFLSQAAAQSKKILVLTEGVIPYLTQDQVSNLAKDLISQPSIAYWITEFFSPQVYRYLKDRVRTKRMKNAPFQFYPDDWNGFFEQRGWIPKEIKYSSEIAAQYGREVPMPWFAVIFRFLAGKAFREKTGKLMGYMIFKRKARS